MNIFNKVLVSDLAITAFFCQQIPGQWGGASVRFVLMLCEIARVLRGMAWPRRGSKRTYSSLSPHWNISPEICADITSILLLHRHTHRHTHIHVRLLGCWCWCWCWCWWWCLLSMSKLQKYEIKSRTCGNLPISDMETGMIPANGCCENRETSHSPRFDNVIHHNNNHLRTTIRLIGTIALKERKQEARLPSSNNERS